MEAASLQEITNLCRCTMLNDYCGLWMLLWCYLQLIYNNLRFKYNDFIDCFGLSVILMLFLLKLEQKFLQDSSIAEVTLVLTDS